MIPHVIRPATEDDMGLVYGSWLRTLAHEYGVPAEEGPRRAFWRANGPALKALVSRSTVLVACSPLKHSEAFAWACAEPPDTLHFAYTKQRGTWGRKGLCRALIKALEMAPKARGTHYTEQGWPRVARCFEKLTLDPYVKGER